MFRNIDDCLWSEVCCKKKHLGTIVTTVCVYRLMTNTFVCWYCHDSILEKFNLWQGLILIIRTRCVWYSKFWDVNECHVAKYKVNVLKFIRTNVWPTFQLPCHLSLILHMVRQGT